MLIGVLPYAGAAWAGQEDEVIGRGIRARADAAATFSETKDKQAALPIYAAEYEGIQDAEAGKRAGISSDGLNGLIFHDHCSKARMS